MTRIERRALLGDRQAQEECTRQGIVLPCPFCESGIVRSTKGHLFHCRFCNFTLTFQSSISKLEALARWNTRPVIQVGRCIDCKYSDGAKVNKNGVFTCPLSGLEIVGYDFCSYFEPKEADNERTAVD